MEITSQSDAIDCLIGSIATPGRPKKYRETGVVHPEIRRKLDRISKESYQIVSMEAELKNEKSHCGSQKS